MSLSNSLLGVYSDPKRDQRFHTVSIVYVCKAYGIPKGDDDAKEAFVYALDDLPLDRLVFDHAQIVLDYLAQRFNTSRDHNGSSTHPHLLERQRYTRGRAKGSI